jgi:predicted permease
LQLRNVLVVGETALACVLLIAAGLMLHSFVNLVRADPGFRPQQVLTASISLPFETYRTESQRRQFYEQLIAGLQSLTGVQSAGVGTDLPWTGYDENAGGFTVEGRPKEFNDQTTARYHAASVDYFRAVGIPLRRGRFFSGRDDKDAMRVVVVNQAMAERYWPGEDALEKRISFDDKPAEKDWLRIVGVVGDVKDRAESSTAQPAFWWPLAQVPFRDVSVALRSNSAPAVLADQLRLTVRSLDPGLAIADLRLMNRIADAAVAGQRFTLFLVGLFAVLALLLATIGIYGVISYSVNQRMGEFGLRMALGARPWDLKRLILGQGLALSVVGAAAGLLSAAGLTRLLGSMLYGVGRWDPLTFAGVAALALGTTAFACYLPARRAADADPMRSLRAE